MNLLAEQRINRIEERFSEKDFQMNLESLIHSIVAQLLNLLQAQDLFKGLNEEQVPLLNIEKSINHIVKFSIGGIKQHLNRG